MAITRDLLDSAVQSFVREVSIEELRQQINDMALDVVKDLQEISFDVVHDMKAVVAQVREIGHDKTLKQYARHIMKDVLMTSRIVMDFVDDLDNIIKLIKSRFQRTK